MCLGKKYLNTKDFVAQRGIHFGDKQNAFVVKNSSNKDQLKRRGLENTSRRSEQYKQLVCHTNLADGLSVLWQKAAVFLSGKGLSGWQIGRIGEVRNE